MKPVDERTRKHRRRIDKEEIVREALKGTFDKNPRLASPHRLTCEKCGNTRTIVYLTFLRSGKFEVEGTRIVEVTYSAPTVTGIAYGREALTPLTVRISCKGCGHEIRDSSITAEWLYAIIVESRQRKAKRITYIL